MRRAEHLQVACAEVTQGNATGTYAESLVLQFREADRWRTAAVVKNLVGGLARLQRTLQSFVIT